MNELIIEVPAEHMRNIFGMYDSHIKKIEHDFDVSIVDRDGGLKIIGSHPENVNKAASITKQLIELSKRGNVIQEQNVDFEITLGM